VIGHVITKEWLMIVEMVRKKGEKCREVGFYYSTPPEDGYVSE